MRICFGLESQFQQIKIQLATRQKTFLDLSINFCHYFNAGTFIRIVDESTVDSIGFLFGFFVYKMRNLSVVVCGIQQQTDFSVFRQKSK